MATGARIEFGRELALIGTAGFLLSFIAGFFTVFSYSLFLNTLGAETLPLYYIVVNIISLVLGGCLFANDAKGTSGLRISNILMAAFFIAAGIGHTPEAAALTFTAFVAATLFSIYPLLFYWNLINRALTIAQMKRHTGALTSCIMFGAITSGFSVKPIVSSFSEKEVFLLGAAVILLFTLNLKTFLGGLQEKTGPEQNAGPDFPVKELFRTDLVRLLLLFTFIFCLARYAGEYQFSRSVTRRFSDTKELSGFLGRLQALTACAILLWQTVFLRKFFNTWPVAGAYIAIAAAFLLLSAACAAYPAFYLLAIFNYSAVFFVKALKQPGQSIFIQAMPKGHQSRANFLLGGIAESISITAAGLSIFLLNRLGLSIRAFFTIVFVLSMLLGLASLKLNIAYIRMLLKNLTPGFFLKNQRLNIFSGFTRIRPGRKSKNTGLYIKESIEALRAPGNPLRLVRAIATLAELDCAGSVGEISPLMAHPNPWIKITAILAVFKLSGNKAGETAAAAELSRMAESPGIFPRALAASVMKNLKKERPVSLLETFLLDENVEVRRGALITAARLKNPSLIPVLRKMGLDEKNSRLSRLINRALSRTTKGAGETRVYLPGKMPEKYAARAGNALLFLDKETVFDTALKALNSLRPPLAVAVAEALKNHGGDERFPALMRECLGRDRFSLVPLITEIIQAPDGTAATQHIFDDLAAHCPRKEINADFAAVSAAIFSAGEQKQKAGKLFSLGLKYALGWKTGEAVEKELMGGGEKEDIALEILETSVKDARMKETLYRLLCFLKPPPPAS